MTGSSSDNRAKYMRKHLQDRGYAMTYFESLLDEAGVPDIIKRKLLKALATILNAKDYDRF